MTVGNKVKLSVCLATFNGEKYIRQQIESILSQLNDHDEVIISDDCSDDGTLAIISSFKDARIKVLSGQRFASPVFNFENAIAQASGDHIFLSDQDDVWLPGRVEVMVEQLKTADLVISDARVVNESMTTLHESFFHFRSSKLGYMNNLIKNRFPGCFMAFNQNLMTKILPFPKRIHMHDWWITLVAELTGQVKLINEPLTLYRRHDSNASETGSKSSSSLFEKVERRTRLLVYSLLRAFFR